MHTERRCGKRKEPKKQESDFEANLGEYVLFGKSGGIADVNDVGIVRVIVAAKSAAAR